MGSLTSERAEEKKAYWSWNIPLDKLSLSSAFCSIFGCSEIELPTSFNLSSRFFKAGDFDHIKASVRQLANTGERYQVQFRTSHTTMDGADSFSLEWEGEVLEWAQNAPVTIVGYAKKNSDYNDGILSLSEEAFLFQKLMHHLPESIYFKDRQSRFITVNKSCAEKFGVESPAEVVGKTDFDFFDEVHAQQAFADEQKIMKTEIPIIDKEEREISADDGRNEQWASTTKLPLYDDDGNLIGTFGITRDITEKKQAENWLVKNEKLISKMSRQIPGIFYIYHQISETEANIPFASDGVKELFELDPEDIRESVEPMFSRVHEDDLEFITESVQQAVSTLSVWQCEFRVVLPKKGVRWIRGKANTELQTDGTVMGYGYMTDITEEKKRFDDITRLRKQLQHVIDSAPNLIFVKTMDGKYLMANESAASFFGQNTSDIIGKTDLDLNISDEKAQHFLELDKTVIENNEPLFIPEDKTILPDGSEAWHQTIKVPFLNTDSGKPAVLSIVTDITKRKRKEIELNNTLDIIGDQNKRLMNFAHIVSHNLRNHAGNISMLLSLYDMEESKEERQELLEHLNTASKRLNGSIADLNEIVDQQYNSNNERKELNLQDTLDKIKEILTTERLAQNVIIKEDIPPDLNIRYNPAYLESIILNLLSNAIKYRHPDRKPEIHVKAEQRSGEIFLEISDNGLGIDLEKYGDKLFGMYNTFHENENSKGIGLFITKNQIESMGGTITVESEPDKGTSFKIKLT